MVFLNGCSTEQHTEGLLAAGVPVVIATSQIIDDNIARKFAEGFYQGMAGGASIHTAYQEAIITVDTDLSGQHRGLKPAPEAEINTPLPWRVRSREGAEDVLNWSMADAANNPLFGLPALPDIQLPESPFRHLQRFQRDHARVFFGRGYEIRDLYHRISNRQGAPILLVYGQSGVGKSSLLEAGLLPRIESEFKVYYRRRESDQDLWSLLYSILSTESDTPSTDEHWLATEEKIGQALVVILDQIEEVFTRPNPANPNEWQNFLDGLNQLFGRGSQRPQGKLILSFRKEWLPEIEGALSKFGLARNRVFIEPLNQRGIIEAIEGPVSNPHLQQHYGLSLENKGLAQSIADDLMSDRDSPVAPVLQILLSKLWDQAKQESISRPYFTRQQYQQLKRDGLLLGDFLDQELMLIEHQQPETVQSGLLLDLLIYFTTPQGTANEHSQNDLANQYGEKLAVINELLAHCQRHYLLVDSANEQQSERSWRLGHDALAPLIKMRYEESDRPGQRARRILENRAADWRGDKTGIVLDEADLTVVESGENGMRQWTADEQRLIDASRRTRQQKNRRNRRYRALAMAGLLLIISTAVIAIWQWRVAQQRSKAAIASQNQAENEQRLALSRQLAAQAQLKLTSTPNDVEVGGLLAVEALKQAQTVEAYRAWSDTMSLLPRLGAILTVKPNEKITAMTYSPDGNFLAATVTSGNKPVGENTQPPDTSATDKSSWGVVKIWDTQTGAIVKELGGAPRWLNVLAYSPDGQKLAAGGADGIITLWDSQTGKEELNLQHDANVTALFFQEEGNRLLSSTKNEEVESHGYWWNLVTKELIIKIPLGKPARAEGNSYGYGRSEEATYQKNMKKDGFATVWDKDEGDETYDTFDGRDKKDIKDVLLSKQKPMIASENLGSTQVWELVKGKKLFSAGTHTFNFTFNDTGKYILTIDKTLQEPTLHESQNIARVWDVQTKQEKLRIVHGDSIITADFNPEGTRIVSGSADHTARLWDIKSKTELARFQHDDEVIFTYVTADDKYLITGDYRNHYIWSLKTKNKLNIIPYDGYKYYVNSLTYDANKQQLAILRGSSTIHLINVNNSGIEQKIIEGVAEHNVLELSDDSQSLYIKKDEYTAKAYSIINNYMLNNIPTVKDINIYKLSTNSPYFIRYYDYVMEVWNGLNGQIFKEIKFQHKLKVTELSPNKSFVATYENDNEDTRQRTGTIRLWNLTTGQENLLLSNVSYSEIIFSPDNKLLATHEYGFLNLSTPEITQDVNDTSKESEVDVDTLKQNSMEVRVWDVINGKELFKLRHNKSVSSVIFNKEGNLILTSDDESVYIWNASNGKLIHHIDPKFFGNDGAFLHHISQNGRYVGAAGRKSIYLIDLQNGFSIKTIKVENLFMSFYFSPDSSLLAVNSKNVDLVTIWSILEQREIAIIKPNTPIMSNLVFTPDNRYLIYGDGIEKVVFFALEKNDQIKDACKRLHRNLTLEEWQTYMPHQSRELTCTNLPMAEDIN